MGEKQQLLIVSVKNLANLSKEELYQIACDKGYRMRDRYMAAKELQERRRKDEVCRNRSVH